MPIPPALIDEASAREAIREIAADARAHAVARASSTHLGLAVLYHHAGEAGLFDDGPALAVTAIEQAIEHLAAGSGNYHLIGGLPGIGWTLDHLLDRETADEVCDPIDQAVEAELAVLRWTSDYDLVRGLAGMGLYGLARAHSERGQAIARRALDHLEAVAERGPEGVAWFTPAELLVEAHRERFPRGRYDYGVAHGIPGVVGLLARYVAADLERERAARLLEGAVAFLLATAPPREPARFPACLAPGQRDHAPTRMAWCYGDPGVAIALLAAARACRRADWEAEARALALRAAACPPEVARVADAALCHGAAGLAHVLRRLHQALGDPELADGARRWFADALAQRRPGDGLGGYRSPHAVEGVEQWLPDPSLLTGAPGTALALLGALGGEDPDWDELLLCGAAALAPAPPA
jgi:hypothetical protein